MTDKTGAERRGFLRALGFGTAAAAGQAAKENEGQRLAARYRESEHVKAYYRTNRYEQ